VTFFTAFWRSFCPTFLLIFLAGLLAFLAPLEAAFPAFGAALVRSSLTVWLAFLPRRLWWSFRARARLGLVGPLLLEFQPHNRSPQDPVNFARDVLDGHHASTSAASSSAPYSELWARSGPVAPPQPLRHTSVVSSDSHFPRRAPAISATRFSDAV